MSDVAPAPLLASEVLSVGLNGDASAIWPPRPRNTKDAASAGSKGSNTPREVQTLLIEKPPSRLEMRGKNVGRILANRLDCTPHLTVGKRSLPSTDASVSVLSHYAVC